MHGSPNSSETLPGSQPSGGTQNCLLLCLARWNSSGSHPANSADPFSRAADGNAETADCRVSNLLGMLQTHCLLVVQIPYDLLDGLRDRWPSRNPEKILAESREMPSSLTFSVSQIQQVWMEYNFLFWLALNYYYKTINIKSFASHVLFSTIDLVSVAGNRIGSIQRNLLDQLTSYIFIFLCHNSYSRRIPVQNYF